MSIIIGKNTLETLTTGMYSDNRTIYREYIQNATDAIDNAVREGIITKEKNQITITVNTKKREIRIKDNGTGIPNKNVFHLLGDVGKSEKDYTKHRGYRGIGRLAGLAYCDELQFITSSKGEAVKTISTWNCVKLKELLRPDVDPNKDLINVIDEIREESSQKEELNNHYFEVVLKGIDKHNSNLLDIDIIKKYLSTVAPVPYDCKKFTQLQKINDKLTELGQEVQEYNIFLETDIYPKEQILKPYGRKLLAGNSEKDFVEDIVFFDGYKTTGEILFLGWYGKTELSGAIKDEEIKGIRVRKHNILVGNENTINEFFGNNPTYQGYNKWFLGEIFVFDANLIPNSQRDDFERNTSFFDFKKAAEKTTTYLATLPKEHSANRSIQKVQNSVENRVNEIKKELDTPLTNARKEKLISELDSLHKRMPKPKVIPAKEHTEKKETITKEKSYSEVATMNKEKVASKGFELINDIKNLKEKIESTNVFPIDKLDPSYPREVRNALKIVFETIDRMSISEGQAKELIAEIIKVLNEKGKNKLKK